MKKTIVTTSWDDGLNTDIKILNLLNKYKLKGTFYISNIYNKTEKNLLSCQQIEKIAVSGHEIGCHTFFHKNLLDLKEKEIKQEIKRSKEQLENIIHSPIRMFFYPYGFYNDKIIKILKELNFYGARCVNATFNKNRYLLFVNSEIVKRTKLNYVITVVKQLFNKNLIYFYYKPVCTKDWLTDSIRLFDNLYSRGGIFSLLGHSWEINQKNYWKSVEYLFKYISSHKDILPMTNLEVVDYLIKTDEMI